MLRPGWLALRTRPKWLIAGVVVLVGAGATGAWAATRPAADAAAAPLLIPVTRGTVRQSVSASGTVAPAREADLTFPSAGRVTAVGVEVGQAVSAGAMLARIDDTDLRGTVASAQASVEAGQSQLDAQRAAGASASQLAAASAQLTAAQSRLAAANRSLADATLAAPFAGTIAEVNVAVGDRVSGGGGSTGGGSTGGATGGGQNSGGATTSAGSGSSRGQIVVIATDAWIVNAAVGAADLPRVKKGLQAEATVTGSATKVFGTVRSVGIVASASSGGTATFPVSIALTGKPTGLYAGATADVVVIVRQRPDVLSVPTAAVRTVNGHTVVKVRRNGVDQDVTVQLGEVFGPATEVKTGINEGDQVVLDGIRPGGTGTGQRGNRTGRTGQGGFPGGGFNGGGFNGGGANRGGGGGGAGGASGDGMGAP